MANILPCSQCLTALGSFHPVAPASLSQERKRLCSFRVPGCRLSAARPRISTPAPTAGELSLGFPEIFQARSRRASFGPSPLLRTRLGQRSLGGASLVTDIELRLLSARRRCSRSPELAVPGLPGALRGGAHCAGTLRARLERLRRRRWQGPGGGSWRAHGEPRDAGPRWVAPARPLGVRPL